MSEHKYMNENCFLSHETFDMNHENHKPLISLPFFFFFFKKGRLCGSAGEILNGEFVYTGVQFGDTATAVCNEG